MKKSLEVYYFYIGYRVVELEFITFTNEEREVVQVPFTHLHYL
jgi:hypothetical protein